jgi:CTD small phosphatase-like protein 2
MLDSNIKNKNTNNFNIINSKDTSDNLELSKENTASTITDNDISENNSINEEIIFEENFYKYYVDSSQNSNGNYDKYITNALKLITLFPKKNFFNEIHEISKNIIFPTNKEHKQTILLDLDETLIHVDFENKYKNYDAILYFDNIDENGEIEKNIQINLIIRPGLFQFLDFINKYFEVFIYTASYKNYADTIIDYIEKDKKYFSLRLYREHCIFIKPGIYIKDLRIFNNRNLKNVILIDNSIFSFANQLNNGILITSFYNDKCDSFLLSLIDYLEYFIEKCDDVRLINKQHFKFEIYKNDLIKENLVL